jgi:hypothetical protein
MKALTFTVLVWISLAATSFGLIGDDEKQIEARYGKAGKDMGTHGEIHEIGYTAGAMMILVDYVKGISQREAFATADASPLSAEAIKQILSVSAPEGTTWQEGPAKEGDRMWTRSDGKAVAMLPALGKFLFVQDPSFVQPPKP